MGKLATMSLALALCAASDAMAEPRRSMRGLCVDERGAQQYVWLQAHGCSAVSRGVPVQSRLPDSDLVELLEQQATVLTAARLLFAGNTQCARLRARPFTLAAIVVGAAVEGGETMAGLVYRGEHGSATVWARRSGLHYTAWNVSCQR